MRKRNKSRCCSNEQLVIRLGWASIALVRLPIEDAAAGPPIVVLLKRTIVATAYIYLIHTHTLPHAHRCFFWYRLHETKKDENISRICVNFAAMQYNAFNRCELKQSNNRHQMNITYDKWIWTPPTELFCLSFCLCSSFVGFHYHALWHGVHACGFHPPFLVRMRQNDDPTTYNFTERKQHESCFRLYVARYLLIVGVRTIII